MMPNSEVNEAVEDAGPVAWIDFADNGNIRFWTADEYRAVREKESGRHLRMFTLAELVMLAAKSTSSTEPDGGVTEAMVDAAFDLQVWKDIERCVKIAFNRAGFQPFTHEGWKDSPVAELYRAMRQAEIGSSNKGAPDEK